MLRAFLTATALVLLGSSVRAQMTQYCFPGVGGTINCPCGQPANPTGGCDNFGGGTSSGGVLSATGVASLFADTVYLHATGLNANVNTFFYTGTSSNAVGFPFGGGVRCVTGSLKVLYPAPKPPGLNFWQTIIWIIFFKDPCRSSSTGAISRPRPTSDHTVSQRTKEVGVPILAGQTRYYFCRYDDPLAATPCGNTASVFNSTNAGSIVWSP